MMRHKRFVPGAAIVAVLTLSACAEGADSPGGESGEEAAAYPTEAIEFVTAGDPGGGLDLFARQIQQALTEEDLLDVQMDITNLGGGGGNPAMEVGRQRSGTADTLIGNSNRVYLNEILGTTDLAVNEDFVPIAQLMTEYVVLAVREDAPYETGPDVVEALAADPRSVTFGVGTVPSDDQLHLLRLAETQDIDPAALNIVAFSSGGDLMTQLLGGQVDAISTGLSEALPQYEAGDIRILAVTAPERLEGPAADIPTGSNRTWTWWSTTGVACSVPPTCPLTQSRTGRSCSPRWSRPTPGRPCWRTTPGLPFIATARSSGPSWTKRPR